MLKKKRSGREGKVRERKGKNWVCVGKCVVCACVYADEICHPQQPPVKRNRISSPRGENLQECRWRIAAHRFLSWTLKKGLTQSHPHTHSWIGLLSHAYLDTCTHTITTRNSVFHSFLFLSKEKGIPLIHKNIDKNTVIRGWNRKARLRC